MKWSQLPLMTVWIAAMVYSALSIGIPEIRVYWKGGSTRLGPVSCLAVALIFWLPPLGILANNFGLLSGYLKPLAILLFFALVVFLFTVGHMMDISETE